jgi:hypothetical protein
MQLFCPACGSALSPEDIDSDGARATCRACSAVTSVAQLGAPTVGTRQPKRRSLREIPRPPHFFVKDDGSSLRLAFRWIWRRFTGPATMCLVWDSFVVLFWWNALRTGDRMGWLAIIFTIPHAAIGLLLVYATLAGLLNRTVVKVTSELITVRHGPVPSFGNRTLQVDELERLSFHKDTDPEKRGWRYVYGVNALTKGASKVDLITELDSDQALFIKQEIERWLHIEDRRGGAGKAVADHS